jgi:hypothetical protein
MSISNTFLNLWERNVLQKMGKGGVRSVTKKHKPKTKKRDRTLGGSHASGYIVEQVGIVAQKGHSGVRKCVKVKLTKNHKIVTAFVPGDGGLDFVMYDGWDIFDPKREYLRLGVRVNGKEQRKKLPRELREQLKKDPAFRNSPLFRSQWRLSKINRNYEFVSSYPRYIAVPRSLTDEDIIACKNFHFETNLESPFCLSFIQKLSLLFVDLLKYIMDIMVRSIWPMNDY